MPRIDGDFAGVGTIAEIQEVERGDVTAVLIAGVQRARIGAGQAGSSEVLWVEAVPVEDASASPRRDE